MALQFLLQQKIEFGTGNVGQHSTPSTAFDPCAHTFGCIGGEVGKNRRSERTKELRCNQDRNCEREACGRILSGADVDLAPETAISGD